MAKTSSRPLERSNLYYTLLGPPLRPLVLKAIQRRLGRDAVRIGAHGGKDSARSRPPHARIRRPGLARHGSPGLARPARPARPASREP
jgi:hypothetical protein